MRTASTAVGATTGVSAVHRVEASSMLSLLWTRLMLIGCACVRRVTEKGASATPAADTHLLIVVLLWY